MTKKQTISILEELKNTYQESIDYYKDLIKNDLVYVDIAEAKIEAFNTAIKNIDLKIEFIKVAL